MDDDIDLSNAELFADANRGLYIPYHFAEAIDRNNVYFVEPEDWKELEVGPEGEFYWETWERVITNAEIILPDGTKYYLHHDGDLWLVPMGADNEY